MVRVSTRWGRQSRVRVITPKCSCRWPGLGLAALAVIVPLVADSRTDDSAAAAPDATGSLESLGVSPSPGSTSVVDAAPLSATGVGVGETSGIEITLDTPGEVRAGTRTPIHVVVRNTGTETFYWQAGGCGLPAEVATGPVGGLVGGYTGRVSADPIWNGDPALLEAAITASEAGRGTQLAQPESATASVSLICTADSKMQAFAPGDELSYSGTAELRVPPGPLLAGGAYQAAATFVGYRSPDDYPNQPLDSVQVQVRFTVVDAQARSSDPIDDVVAAIVVEGRLASWLPKTIIPDRPDLVQAYRVGMSWWRDAWELWVEPYWGGGMLRVRVDPANNEVIDVRTHHSNGPPDDEPDASSIPGTQPD